MISKSKLGAALAAIAFISAIGLAAPSFAGPNDQGYTGGGSAGYNHHVSTDYRLKKHPKHHAAPNSSK